MRLFGWAGFPETNGFRRVERDTNGFSGDGYEGFRRVETDMNGFRRVERDTN